VPRELPADTTLLAGRDQEQRLAARALLGSVPEDAWAGRNDNRSGSGGGSGDRPQGRGGPVFVAVHGPAGIGKTALAVRVATRLAPRFPDGQIYVDLHGSATGREPRRPVDVLAQCLRSLGVPDARIPDGEEEAAARYRTVAANRRLLVVLEDAAGEEQVRPLLTATAGSAVIITSRRRLTVHDRTVHVALGPLTVADSLDVLGRLCGPGADRAALLRLARGCGGSPAALRQAATALTDPRPRAGQHLQ
jgi:hypothetical protein